MLKRTLFTSGLVVTSLSAMAEHQITPPSMEVISVTATRIARDVQDVPESISVIDSEQIEQARMFNIADAISGTPGVNITSKSGGYDTRLIIRGGGLKANFGIREIFMMRDGIPITDPDSFSKLDYIDTQDIAQIEITKGPGNIYATGSSGGVVHILSRSVFEDSDNYLAMGAGDEGSENVRLRLADSDGQRGYALTASYRKDDNDWRANNRFESSQVSFKYGQRWEDERELVLEVGYTDANLDLPGDMDEAQFRDYLHSGEQTDSNTAFKDRGRYSKNLNANLRYQVPLDDHWSFAPKFYYSHWSQYHPVVPMITTASGVDVMGSDLEFTRTQDFGSLVAGITYRREKSDGNKKYQYRDLETLPSGRLITTLSNAKGDLSEISDSLNTVQGVFAQQSITAFENWTLDFTFRYDEISVEQENYTFSEYNWGRGVYQPVTTDNAQRLDEVFHLSSQRVGVSYRLNDHWNLYANLAHGEQVPFASELEENPTLQASEVDSFEVGLKGRDGLWEYELALYAMSVSDEIISILDENRQTTFQNAGETRKRGVELASNLQLADWGAAGNLWGGLNYTYSDYTFSEFQEIVTSYGPFGPIYSEVDRADNQLPFIPRHAYSVSLNYRHPNGFAARLQSDSWGDYYVDNANSEKDDGYQWLTSLNLSYQFLDHHKVALNVSNLSDKRYASVVKKDIGKEKSYTPGAPRSWLLSYRYSF